MRTMIQRIVAAAAFAVCLGATSTSFAASVVGKVTFVGTISELNTAGVLEARFRVRVAASSCDGGSVRDRWLVVRSGQMQGNFTHNLANTRNAYSTLMAAFLAGKSVQVDSSTISCSSTADQNVSLWVSNIGVF